MEPFDKEIVTGTPLNELVRAINHYVSTGDNYGDAVAFQEEDCTVILIPVNTYMPADVDDFEKFKSRFDEIKLQYDLKLTYVGRFQIMDTYQLMLNSNLARAVAQELLKQPGKLGWGSCKADIDKNS